MLTNDVNLQHLSYRGREGMKVLTLKSAYDTTSYPVMLLGHEIREHIVKKALKVTLACVFYHVLMSHVVQHQVLWL